MAKELNDLEKLRIQVSRLTDQNKQALARLERQASAVPELTFAKIAEMLSAMPHVDHVLIQLSSDAHDYPTSVAAGTGGKNMGWQHSIKWRVFIREYPHGRFADRTELSCYAAVKAVLDEIQLPMPAGLEKLAQSLE